MEGRQAGVSVTASNFVIYRSFYFTINKESTSNLYDSLFRCFPWVRSWLLIGLLPLDDTATLRKRSIAIDLSGDFSW